MNSVFVWGFVIFCAAVALIAFAMGMVGFYKPKKIHHMLHKHVPKKQLLAICAALMVLSLGSGTYVYWLHNNQRSIKNEVTTKAQVTNGAPPANKPSGSLPAYEIVKKPSNPAVSKTASINSQRIAVYVDSTDKDRLTALSNQLLKQYKGYSSKQWYIDFFDNKSVATSYFGQINNPKLSASEKRRLTDHYVAVCMVDPAHKASLFLLKQASKQTGGIELTLP